MGGALLLVSIIASQFQRSGFISVPGCRLCACSLCKWDSPGCTVFLPHIKNMLVGRLIGYSKLPLVLMGSKRIRTQLRTEYLFPAANVGDSHKMVFQFNRLTVNGP